jgi:hypothetical protein
MSSIEDRWPAALDYPEPEPVQLDIASIIRRGTRRRRARRAVKAATVIVACGIVPAAVTTDIAVLAAPGYPQAGVARGAGGVKFGTNSGTYGTSAAPSSGQRHSSEINGGTHSEPGVITGMAGLSGTPRPYPAVRLRTAASFPARYGPLRGLAGDQAGTGVWAWGATAGEVRLIRVRPNGTSRSWLVLRLAGTLASDGQAAFAVSAGGVAWLGMNATLVRFDTVTGAITSWAVPVPAAGGASGHHAIRALALGPGGRVAILLDHSSSAVVLNEATGRFTELAMPNPADQPISAGFARSGLLGVGFQTAGRARQPGVLLVPRSGRSRVAAVTQPDAVSPYGTASLLVGSVRPEVVSANGAVRPLVLPVPRLDLTGLPQPPVPLASGRLVTFEPGSVLVYAAHARSTAAAIRRFDRYRAPSGLHDGTVDSAGYLWALDSAHPDAIVIVTAPR